MASTKTKDGSTKTSNDETGVIYDVMLKELQALAKSKTAAKKVEDSVLNEARGREAWVLHTILRAVSEQDNHMGGHAQAVLDAVQEFRTQVDNHVLSLDKSLDNVSKTQRKDFEKSWKQQLDNRKQNKQLISELETTQQENFAAARDLADENQSAVVKTIEDESASLAKQVQEAATQLTTELDGTENTVLDKVHNVHEATNAAITEFRSALQEQVSTFMENSSENFESTNERVRTEVNELSDRVTGVMDKRFNHIDQTFAAVRGDLEVLKALVMELIKERVGRPEMVGGSR